MATLKNTIFDGTESVTLPAGTTAQRPASPQQGMIRYNTTESEVEYYDGSNWILITQPDDPGTITNPASAPSQIYDFYGSPSNGSYWYKPPGANAAFECYTLFNHLGLHWIAVTGMSSGGVRADANGNSSGLAGLRLDGENHLEARLTNTNFQNNNGLNFSLPRDWINACRPKGLRVISTAEDMTGLFNGQGYFARPDDIWAFYYAANRYNDVPSSNGNRFSTDYLANWVSDNVRIYEGTTNRGAAFTWSGNNHLGWSTSTSDHMLHGSTNFSYPGPYPGFCLDNTCWNQSGIVYLGF